MTNVSISLGAPFGRKSRIGFCVGLLIMPWKSWRKPKSRATRTSQPAEVVLESMSVGISIVVFFIIVIHLYDTYCVPWDNSKLRGFAFCFFTTTIVERRRLRIFM